MIKRDSVNIVNKSGVSYSVYCSLFSFVSRFVLVVYDSYFSFFFVCAFLCEFSIQILKFSISGVFCRNRTHDPRRSSRWQLLILKLSISPKRMTLVYGRLR